MATKATEIRHAVEGLVATGKATLGEVKARHEFYGLRCIAKNLRLCYYEVDGVPRLAKREHLDAEADKRLAEELQKLPSDTIIRQIRKPVRRNR